MIREVTKDLAGKRALVIGRSNIVGKPMAHLLLQQDCTVTIAHSRTRDMQALCLEADILVAAIGYAFDLLLGKFVGNDIVGSSLLPGLGHEFVSLSWFWWVTSGIGVGIVYPLLSNRPQGKLRGLGAALLIGAILSIVWQQETYLVFSLGYGQPKFFGGLFAVDKVKYVDPVLVSSVDGVGTKLKVAFDMDLHSTVGADLVNHCVNDIAVQGAVPLFFLDYFAVGKLDAQVAGQVIEGVARGCRANGGALIGAAAVTDGQDALRPGRHATDAEDRILVELQVAGTVAAVQLVERLRIELAPTESSHRLRHSRDEGADGHIVGGR